jgi:hypothetical protein
MEKASMGNKIKHWSVVRLFDPALLGVYNVDTTGLAHTFEAEENKKRF